MLAKRHLQGNPYLAIIVALKKKKNNKNEEKKKIAIPYNLPLNFLTFQVSTRAI